MSNILYKELSFAITGLCFKVHNNLGRFCREKQYSESFEALLKDSGFEYKREYEIKNFNGDSPNGNRVDFLVNKKIIIDFKAKRIITKEDYQQMQRYLKGAQLELGLIINFRDMYLKPKRVLNVLADPNNIDNPK